MSSDLGGWRGKRKGDVRANHQQLCSMRGESGGYSSITLSQKIVLRPFMRGVCLSLCGIYFDITDIKKSLCFEQKNEQKGIVKFFYSPPGGRIECRRKREK